MYFPKKFEIKNKEKMHNKVLKWGCLVNKLIVLILAPEARKYIANGCKKKGKVRALHY